jgi:hypothetical protein
VKRALWALGCALFLAGAVAAVEVRLRDGTVLEASSVRITGSYVMLELVDGRRVAYDVADVDVEALRAGENQESGDAAPVDTDDGLSSGRTLKNTASLGETEATGLAITDREVRHVRGSGVLGDDEMEETPPSTDPDTALPEGYREGGNVLLNRVRVTALGFAEDEWQVSGEVINRNRYPVRNISVRLENRPGPGDAEWRSQIEVTNYLDPGEKALFSHSFAAAKPIGRDRPDVRATVIWMEQEQTGASGPPVEPPSPARRIGTGPPSQPTPIQ